MTINQISFKIFKKNVRRYIIFFASSCFTIMVFFTYMSILTNKDFLNPNKVNSSLSSMIIAPTIFVSLFSLFFVLYAQASFIKYRKTEYGMFMVLGMTNLDVAKMMIFENSCIGFVSLITGLIFGRLFSWLFFICAMKLIEYKGIGYSVSLNSYIYTIVFFTAIYLLVILYSLFTSFHIGILNLIKASRKAEKNILSNPVFALVGIAMLLFSFLDILFNYTFGNNSVVICSILICFIGVFFLISNVVGIFEKLFKLSKKRYFKNIIFLSNIKYSFGQSKRILFLITLLVSMTIFFSSMGIVFISNAQNFATQYNPYHIAYAQIYGKNKLAPETVNSIVNSGVTPLTNTISVDYIQTGSVSILSAAELNKKLGSDIHVNTGRFINLFQVVLTDGYEHQMIPLNRFPVGNIQLTSQGNLVKVIINTLPALGTSTIILNNYDYVKLMQQVSSEHLGIIHLFNYKDWRKTAPVADKLAAALHEYNIHNKKSLYGSDIIDSKVLSPVSRIGIYTQVKQAGGFMLFLFSFVGLLFFISAAVMIHFKLLTEFEKEKIKYKKLFKIGITKRDLAGLISKELLVLFLLPNLVASIIAAIYNYSIPIKPGEGLPSLYFSIEVGAVYLCLQVLYYFMYKKYYIGRFNYIFE